MDAVKVQIIDEIKRRIEIYESYTTGDYDDDLQWFAVIGELEDLLDHIADEFQWSL